MRNKLKETRERLGDLRQQRTEAMRERDAAKEAFAKADTSEGKITEHPDFVAAEEAVKKVGEIDDQIADLKQAESGILQLIGEAGPAAGNDPIPGGTPVAKRGWDGHGLLTESEDYNRAREMGVFESNSHFGTVNFGHVASREEAIRFLATAGQGGMQAAALPGAPAGNLDSTVGYIAPDHRGTIPPRLMPLTLLDLIP